MIAVSDAWKDIQQRFLLPESYVEIECTVTETDAQNSATATGTTEAIFSNVGSVLGTDTVVRYATTEQNLWSLDGAYTICPNNAPYGPTGYVCNNDNMGSVTLTFPEIKTKAVSGVTITWDSKNKNYPPVFEVIVKNGNDIIDAISVTDNSSYQSEVALSVQNYDSIEIIIHNWSFENRRPRIEKIILGHILTLTKSDILGYTHEQHGDLSSGEISKNSIEFKLDNTDGRWNPTNPNGMERYLSERQKLSVRYGLDINGIVEWINAGTFYLSDWKAPSNGLEASFVARDIFEYLLNEKYKSTRTEGTLAELIAEAFASAGVPSSFSYELAPVLGTLTAVLDPNSEYTCAQIVQMCANMGACVIWQDRDGILHITEFTKPTPGFVFQYVIPASLSYSHPDIELSKPLKSVSVDYGAESPYVLEVGNSGETQTVSNPFVKSQTAAEKIARNVAYCFKTREVVSGDFRSDPRLDLFDIVAVESKYGELSPVVITNIKYEFGGSFRGNYTGRVIEYSEEV